MHIAGSTLLLALATGSTVSAAVVSQSTACDTAASAKISSSVSSQVSSSVSSRIAASVSSQVAASVSSKVAASVSASVAAQVASSISSQLAAKTSLKSSAKVSSTSKKTSTSTSAKSSTKISTSSQALSRSSSTIKTSTKTSLQTSLKSSSTSKTSSKALTSSTISSKSSSISQTSAKASFKSSSTTSLAPIPTDPTKVDYQLAPIPDFQDADKFSIDKGPYAESAHFRLYGQDNDNTTIGLQHLEGTWDCYVNKLGWRSSGLSTSNTDGRPPYYKTNYFVIDNLVQYGFSGRTFQLFDNTGAGFVVVDSDYITQVGVMSHEYGHVLSMAEPAWWNQQNTFGWAETLGNFVAETYRSDLCADSRARANDTTGTGGTALQPFMVIGQSYRTMVEPTNNYFAWPFLSYLTYNLDNYSGFGADTMRTIFNTYNAKANETPFHTINRMAVSAGTTVQNLVGRYWARMAFADYGNPVAQNYFRYLQPTLDYNNTFAAGNNTYQVYPERAPRYFGSSIIPLNNLNPSVTATVTAQTAYTAYLVVQSVNVGVRFGNKYGDIRYIELVSTSGQGGIVKTASTDIADGELAMLVVANTPDKLLMYDATQAATGPASVGMNFTFTLDGATN
ncbi:hypothetical protein KCV01_g7396, partial [Aureobasidium melanogenum]